MNDILYHVNVLEMSGYYVWNLNVLFSIVYYEKGMRC
jgi:hypothetical protein